MPTVHGSPPAFRPREAISPVFTKAWAMPLLFSASIARSAAKPCAIPLSMMAICLSRRRT